MAAAGELRFRVSGWSAWTDTLTEPAAWDGWVGKAVAEKVSDAGCLPPADLPMMLRRRASPLGRVALAAAMGLPDVNGARYVMSSRHGELSRTATILESLVEKETPSPADFSMSVHHGLIGLLSIATGNRKGHSAVSAGPESFCYGMLEAAACTVESPAEPVILLHYDERPGDGFEDFFEDPENEGPIVAALCLHGFDSADGTAVVMRATAHTDTAARQNHALDFLRFIASGADRVTSRGHRTVWEWCRA